MTTPDLPPVGATVTVDGCAGEFIVTAPGRWTNTWSGDIEDDVVAFMLDDRWRAEQRIGELEAERDKLYALRAERRIREMEQRLATFEALAREARDDRGADRDECEDSASEFVARALRRDDRLAALATPGEGATT